MGATHEVQFQEIPVILRYEHAPLSSCEFKYLIIGNPAVRLASVDRSQDIVPQSPELLKDEQCSQPQPGLNFGDSLCFRVTGEQPKPAKKKDKATTKIKFGEVV